MKRKNSGFTLIEMIVAVAILGIATLGIGSFFVSAARSYSSVSDETSLQYEAQLTLNQIENMLIDSTLGVSYNVVTSTDESASGFHFVEKDSEASGTAVSKVLYAFNVNETDGSKLDVLLMKWHAANKAIYYKVVQVTNSGNTVSSISVAQDSSWDLLAEDVIAFSADLSEYEKTKKIEIDLDFENRSKDYQTTGTVLLRNNVLINEDSIAKIYEHITQVIKSQITGLELKANPTVTVPGGAVQLTAKVGGTGYPSQDIHQWIVATKPNFEAGSILYDSSVTYNTMPKTYIDTADRVLYVSDDTTGLGNTFNEMLYVKAIVNTTEADGDPVSYEATASVGVKLISNIEVSVYADVTQTYNKNLDGVAFTTTSLVAQRANSSAVPSMTLNPKNVVVMKATVTASDTTTTTADKEIVWSIHSVTDGVIAEIDNTGTLEINQYSKVGSFVVRAALKLDNTVYVDYIVNVGTQYNKDNADLEITTSQSSVNRGGSVECSLTLNGTAVENQDYDWTVNVISSNGQEISGTPVIVNGDGQVFANYDLSYDYSYDVWITASLKSNPEITEKAKITVPKVSLTLRPMTKYSVMGATVSGITCTAIGLEEYDIKWSMSKDLNPNYFFTAWGNFNITGSKNADGTGNATVVLGAEDDPQTNCTVKAYLKDNTNYSATMRIFTGDIRMNITGATSITRGNSTQLDVALTSSTTTNITISKETCEWEITDVKVSGSTVSSLLNDKITIVNGKLSVDATYAADYENYEVVITIRAYDDNYGLEDTHTVKIPAAEINVFPNMILIPDLSSATTVQYTAYENATWYMYKTSGSSNKVTFDTSTLILSAEANDASNSDNAKYTIRMNVGNVTKTGGVCFGFEDTTSGEIKFKENIYKTGHDGKEKKYTRQLRLQKSNYYVLGSNGELFPVYYVTDITFRDRSGEGGGGMGDGMGGQQAETIRYAFVSSKESADGTGQWYLYSQDQQQHNPDPHKPDYNQQSTGSWAKIDYTPEDWNHSYFVSN